MNHYKALGVAKTATQEEIKAAYRKAAARHHPDKGGSAALFHEVQKAYEVIGDPVAKKSFDESESKKPVESLRKTMETLIEEVISKCRPKI